MVVADMRQEIWEYRLTGLFEYFVWGCGVIGLVCADIREAEDWQDELARHGFGCVVVAGLAPGNDSLLAACRLVVVDEACVPAFLDHQARLSTAAGDVLVLVAVTDHDKVSALTARVIGYIGGIVAVVERQSLSRALLAVLEGLRGPAVVSVPVVSEAAGPAGA